MLRIAHISDIHIRNYRFHDDYKFVFEKLYSKLRELKPDIIINTGDTAHTKLQISPSYVEMASDFFENLSKIAPYYMILGNHDLNLRNISKIDAISPIVNALNNDNIFFLRDSCEVIIKDKYVLNHLSILDENSWKTDPSDINKINIALFHGCIAGVKTDQGWVMDRGDLDLSRLSNFDYALLGDIHKSNQIVDTEGRVRYAGSLIQQNHGEDDDKGFLIWDIEDKNNFEVSQHIILSPRPFITVSLPSTGILPSDLSIPPGSRVRVTSAHRIDVNSLKKALDIIKKRYEASSVTYSNKFQNNFSLGDSSKDIGNIRSLSVQEKLIKDYLEDYSLSKDKMNKIIDLNNRLSKSIEDNTDVKRNIRWSLKSMKWDNLFNYSEGNKIDFNNLNGIVGIFGKNYTGKSSIVDSILYGLYNSISKNNRKTYDIINQNKDTMSCELVIGIEEDEYVINRAAVKYVRNMKGTLTNEARSTVEFEKVDSDDELNESSRTATDKEIRRYFGELEDFKLINLSSQNGALEFIDEGSTKRKEIMAKFLDLNIFDKKYKMAKEESNKIKNVISFLDKDYDKQKIEHEFNIEKYNKLISKSEIDLKKLREDKGLLYGELKGVELSLARTPSELNNFIFSNKNLSRIKNKIESLIEEKERYEFIIEEKIELIKKINKFIMTLEIESYKTKKEEYTKKNNEIKKIISEINIKNRELKRKETDTLILNLVPCGDSFPNCKFIKNAHSSKKDIINVKNSLAELDLNKIKIKNTLGDIDSIEEYLDNYNKIIIKKNKTDNDIRINELKLENVIAIYDNFIMQEKEEEKNKSIYESNKFAIEEIKVIREEMRLKTSLISSIEQQEKELVKVIKKLNEDKVISKFQLTTIQNCENEISDLRSKYSIYDLYQKSMHPNGISYSIIKNKLPSINDEISKLLASVVDFEVFFVNETNKLKIYLKHPKYEARALELGSGAEKTIAAMAIRLALSGVTSLPLGDILILDEPATDLDRDNMEGFIKILEMARSKFKIVLLISHLDSLKDCVDTQLIIEKVEGYAHIDM